MTETKGKEWREIQTYWLGKDVAEHYSDPREPAKYPDKFLPLVRKSHYEALQAERDELKRQLDNCWNDRGSYWKDECAKVVAHAEQWKKQYLQEWGFKKKLERENAELRAELKEKNLAKEIDNSRTPKGFQKVEAYSNGSKFVILGEPDESHNCDQMGCGSLDHVIFRSSYLESERDNLRQTLEKCVKALQGKADDWDVLVQAQELLKEGGGGE